MQKSATSIFLAPQAPLHSQSFVDELEQRNNTVLDTEMVTKLLSIAQKQRCGESKGFTPKITYLKCLQVDIGTCMLILDTEEKTRTERKALYSAPAGDAVAEC